MDPIPVQMRRTDMSTTTARDLSQWEQFRYELELAGFKPWHLAISVPTYALAIYGAVTFVRKHIR
jgi:hypothetical protein